MMKSIIRHAAFALVCSFVALQLNAQSVGVGTNTPHSSALLDVTSTTKGMLVPRMTTAQRTSIASPAIGLLVFDTDLAQFSFYNGTAWTAIPNSSGGGSGAWTVNGQNQYSALSGNVGIGNNAAYYKFSVGDQLDVAGLNPLAVFNSKNNQSVVVGDSSNGGKGLMIGYDGNDIQGRSGTDFAINSHLILNKFGGNVGIGNDNPDTKLHVSGKTKTDSLQLVEGATDGYILRSDANGNAVWVNPSILTGTNYWTLAGDSLFNNSGVNVGIGTGTPTNKLQVVGNTSIIGKLAIQTESIGQLGLGLNNSGIELSTENLGSSQLNMALFVDSHIGNTINLAKARGTKQTPAAVQYDDNTLTIMAHGYDGQKFVPSALIQAKVSAPIKNNIVPGALIFGTADTLTEDILERMIIDHNGRVGIGTTLPTTTLDVIGKTKTDSLQLTAGASNGYVLQTDANGNASWVNANTLAVTYNETDPKIGSLSTNKTSRWNGSQLSEGIIYDDSTNVGIGTATPAQKLEVAGNAKADTVMANRLQMTNGATNGYVLQTDANGNATWVNANTLAVTYNETDPKVGTVSNNKTARWNGSQLVNGLIHDDSTNVGIGTISPSQKLEVAGNAKADTVMANKLQMTNGATNGYILQTDANGNATWVNPSTIVTPNSWTVNGSNQYSNVADNVGIGTATPQDKLHVKGNLRLDSSRISFQNTGGSILIGQNAGAADPFTATANNTFIGTNAGQSFINGANNIALGENALQAASLTVENIAIGKQALGNGVMTGAANIAVGTQSGLVNTGISNIFMGQSAGATNSNGNDNIMIGKSTGNTLAPSTGSRNVFIGLNAGTNEMGSDKLIINSSTNTVLPPLVYGDFNTKLFRVNGTFNINNNYSLPGSAGTNNFVLKSDGGGNTSWANVNTLVNSTWTTSGTNQYSSNTGNVGVGTNTPGTKLDVVGTTRTTAFQLPTGATAGHVLRSDATGNATWVNPNTISFTETDPQVSSATTDRIPKWNGTALTDGIIIDNGVNIGISTSTPTTKLDVNGTTKTVGFQMLTGAVAGHILRTDEFGLGTWVNPATIIPAETDPQVGVIATNKLARWNGNVLTNGIINDDSTNVGIGTNPVAANRLTVLGKTQVDSIQTTRFQMTNGAANGFVLQTDVNGRASWVNANTLTITETDPQVAATTTNRIPKWNGTALVDGLLFDNGTNIGIGNTAPADKLHVTGNLRVDNGRVDFRNTGGSVFVGTDAGLNDDKTSNFNTYIGDGAGKANTSGSSNVAVGRSALFDDNIGSENVVVGHDALINSSQATGNVVIGSKAGYQAGDYNTVIGWEAGGIMQSGSTGNVYIGPRAGYNIGGDNKLYIGNFLNSALIYGDFSTGRIGIGSTNPTQAKLVVSGSAANTFASYGYLNRTTPTGTVNGNTTAANYSIYASDRMAASEFNAYSDARIKNIKGITDNTEDLKTLMGIEITNYTLKDVVAKGNTQYKKVIAQQVERVYPQAVTKMTDVVPDIYTKATIKAGKIVLANTLKAGDVVKLIFEKEEVMATVKSAKATEFTVDTKNEGNVFVFGKQVNDFRSVDYEALSTLNISATQELLKRIEALEKELKALKQQQPVTTSNK
jgi:hypothetical protein